MKRLLSFWMVIGIAAGTALGVANEMVAVGVGFGVVLGIALSNGSTGARS